jgi:hypothetical protein
MPDITIIKLKIRRGTDAQRKSVVLEQGELGYTTDTKRVFVGDGLLSGGNIVGNVSWSPQTRTNITTAQIGDIVYDNSLLYQLTGTDYSLVGSWAFIGSKADGSTLTYSGNQLVIKDNGITGTKFASSAASGGLIATVSNGISANVDNVTLKVTNTNVLSVGVIDQKHINSSALGNGLQGGSGTVLSVRADTDYFGFSSNTLTLNALPDGIVTAYSLSADSFGAGLDIVGDKLQATINDTLVTDIQNVGGQIKLADYGNAGNSGNLFKNLVFDSKGRALSSYNSIIDTLSGTTAGYAGHPAQQTLNLGGRGQTLVDTLSWNSDFTTSVVKVLSSAGFITFESVNSQNGTAVDRFAIPIFSYN